MNKKLSMFASAGIALVLAATPMFGVSAIKPSTGATIQITRKTVSNNIAINAEFGYELKYNAAKSETNGWHPSETPITATITYAGEKSATTVDKTANISLSGVDFTKVGSYAYDLKEVSSSDQAHYPRSERVYPIFVEVTNNSGSLAVSVINKSVAQGNVNSIVFEGGQSVDPATPETKPDVDPNTGRTYLQVKSNVTGEGADVDLCIPYTLDASNLPDGTYTVKTSTSACSNPASFEKDTSHKTFAFKLKSGDILTFGQGANGNQLFVNTAITVTQDTPKGYENNDKTSTKNTVANGSQNVFAFTASKGYVPKTGVPYNFIPFILIAVAGAAGAGFVINKRKADR